MSLGVLCCSIYEIQPYIHNRDLCFRVLNDGMSSRSRNLVSSSNDGRRARKHGRVYGRGGGIEIKNSGEKEKGAKVIN